MSWTMHAQTREVLSMIVAVGDVGILRTDLRQHFPKDASLGRRLENLVERGYAIKQGKYNDARFFATSKRPAEAAAAQPATGEPGTADPEVLMRAEARSKAPRGVPPGVPSSVFHLGQLHALAAGVTSFDVLTARPAAAPNAPCAAPGAAPPAAPPAAEPAPAGPFSVEPLHIPTLKPLREQLERRAAVAPAAEGQTFSPATPHFELHSDGVLVIDPAGDGTEPITLPPTLTRHLFRWLDRIGGLQLSRLVADEAATEAAS